MRWCGKNAHSSNKTCKRSSSSPSWLWKTRLWETRPSTAPTLRINQPFVGSRATPSFTQGWSWEPTDPCLGQTPGVVFAEPASKDKPQDLTKCNMKSSLLWNTGLGQSWTHSDNFTHSHVHHIYFNIPEQCEYKCCQHKIRKLSLITHKKTPYHTQVCNDSSIGPYG